MSPILPAGGDVDVIVTFVPILIKSSQVFFNLDRRSTVLNISLLPMLLFPQT
jgi:hypothetical protein